jgi:uncharacterized damage-inducible protein DinB
MLERLGAAALLMGGSGMSTELERLESQLKRSFEGEAWHGPSVLEALEDITPEAAYAHPVAGAHSVWELLLHLGSTYRLVLRRLHGENAQLTPTEDWPSVPSPTPTSWSDAISTLQDLNKQVRSAVLLFNPQQLDQPMPAAAPYTAYTQFIGLTQHDLYHAGQIAILMKASRAAGSPQSDEE